MDKKNILIGIIAFVALLIYSSAYVVDQRERAILFKFREIVNADLQPGLHFKIPFVHTVKKLPAQILTMNADSERFLTGEKKYVVVDFFVKWRISDYATFYRSTSGGVLENARFRLEQIMKDGLRNEFSRRTIEEALAAERGVIMQSLEDKSNVVASQLGIDIVDVRVSKIDFPETVSESVFDRMKSERQRVAQEFRSGGQEDAEKTRAAADRQATILMAEAYKDAERIRGEGDAIAAEIYAKAYQQDAEFYAFYRSLNAYKNTLGQGNDIMVLEPDSEFFRYFRNQNVTPSPSRPQVTQQMAPPPPQQVVPPPSVAAPY